MGGDFLLVLVNLISPGARVKKGDVVAEFDRQFQLLRIDDYKATVAQATANIRKLEADLAVTKEAHQQSIRMAKADLEKARLDLKTLEVVSDIDQQRLKLAAEEAGAKYKQLLSEVRLLEVSQKAGLRASEIELEQARIELQRAQNNVDRMLIKAPMDGIVVMQSIRRGMEMGQVQQGDQVFPGQMFMTIVDPSSMVVNANVNQVDSEALRIGMKARVKLDAYPGLELPGHVYSIGAVPIAGRRGQFMKELKVRLKLGQMDTRVIPDLSASADVTLSTAKQSPIVPLNAVLRDSPSSAPYVFVRSAEQWLRREVKLGLQNSVSAVVESGLKPGDVVAAGPDKAAGAKKPGDGKSPG